MVCIFTRSTPLQVIYVIVCAVMILMIYPFFLWINIGDKCLSYQAMYPKLFTYAFSTVVQFYHRITRLVNKQSYNFVLISFSCSLGTPYSTIGTYLVFVFIVLYWFPYFHSDGFQ